MNSVPLAELDFSQVFPIALFFVSRHLLPAMGIAYSLVLGAGILNFILKHYVSAKNWADRMV